MKSTRRNHYRILHVQPEAPVEIIAASYRTLMTKLRAHPDLGGDPDAAVLLNQAYAVLSDPEQRRAYDASLRAAAHQARAGDRQAAAEAARAAGPGWGRGSTAPLRACVWCGEPVRNDIRTDARCQHCESPLAAPQTTARHGQRELFGRRRTPRLLRSSAVAVFTAWGEAARGGRLQDISLNGLKVLVDGRIGEGRRIRVTDASMDVLAEVVACHRSGRYWTVHARVTQVALARRTGAFVSTEA